MMPGINPRQMQGMMRKMGISQQEIEAIEVIIRTPEHNIIISDPQVTKVNMAGQQTYQIVGDERIEAVDASVEISEDDIQTVMEQTQVSKEEAEEAIRSANGDLAQAIIDLQDK